MVPGEMMMLVTPFDVVKIGGHGGHMAAHGR